MKRNILSAATVLALALSAPLAAHEGHGCLDEACTLQALVPVEAGGGAGVGAIEAQRYGSWGFDTAGMDTSVSPGSDFFAYASGQWAKTTQIPSDQSSYGNFRVLRDLSETRVRSLLDSYPKADPATGGDAA